MPDPTLKSTLHTAFEASFHATSFTLRIPLTIAPHLAEHLEQLIAGKTASITLINSDDRRLTLRILRQHNLFIFKRRFDDHADHNDVSLNSDDLDLLTHLCTTWSPQTAWNHLDLTNRDPASPIRDVTIGSL